MNRETEIEQSCSTTKKRAERVTDSACSAAEEFQSATQELSKIDRIRASALTIISQRGIANSSVQLIAKAAGVSDGYLYRHYNSKEALVGDLLEQVFQRINDEIQQQLDQKNSVEVILENFIGFIFDNTVTQPDKIKFMIMLQNDFSFEISHTIINRLRHLCERVLEVAGDSTALRANLSVEELYTAMISIPLQYATLSFRAFFGESNCTPQWRERIINQCLASLR